MINFAIKQYQIIKVKKIIAQYISKESLTGCSDNPRFLSGRIVDMYFDSHYGENSIAEKKIENIKNKNKIMMLAAMALSYSAKSYIKNQDRKNKELNICRYKLTRAAFHKIHDFMIENKEQFNSYEVYNIKKNKDKLDEIDVLLKLST